MSAVEQPKRRKVRIVCGPHGNSTILEMDGEPVKNACAFSLSNSVGSPTQLTITYTNVEVEVEALVEETEYHASNRTFRRIQLVEDAPTDENPEDV